MLKGKCIERVIMVTIYDPYFHETHFISSFKYFKIIETNKDLICEYSELSCDISNV